MDKNLLNLKSDLKDKKQMVLFLGAGVNFDSKVKLLWNDVLSEFLDNSLPLLNMPPDDIAYIRKALDTLNNEDLYIQKQGTAEFTTEAKIAVVKQLLGKAYVPLLKNIIYKKCNKYELARACDEYITRGVDEKTPFYTLFAIAEFILTHNNIKAVVTYNYDNFLTVAIRLLLENKRYFKQEIREDLKPIDVYSGWGNEPFTNSSFLIYHIHGYIPSPGELIPNKRNTIVMSLDEFYNSAKEVYSWQTATQIHFLSHYSCLLLGMSLSDMTMQRMIYNANINYNCEKVYYVMQNGNPLLELKSRYHSKNHLSVIKVNKFIDFYKEILK